MVASSEFQSYLQEICHRYEQWWTKDALTETIAAQQATFSFEQIVQTKQQKKEPEGQKEPPSFERKEETEEQKKEPEGQKKQLPIVSLPILKGIQNYIESEHILLVGSPGVGKSTTLLRCLVSFAKAELEKPEPRIPVLVPLKRYNVPISGSEDPSGMLALIRDALKPQLRLRISDVEDLLFQKRLILLLDGLNEMPADSIRTHLKAFREECKDSKIPLICTTRELGSGDLGITRRLEIQPLSPLEINRFLQECMPSRAQKVLQLLSRDNRELSRTPFVLWMLYQVFQETGTVAETLGEAFREFFKSFKKFKEDAPVTDERRKKWNPWLEHLAFTMLNSLEPNDPGLIISDDRANKVLAEKFGDLYGASSRIEELLKYHLLERVSDKEISFHHQLIQEYYAAEQLTQHLTGLSDEELKYYYLNNLKWTEPLAMSMSFVESDALAEQMVRLSLEVDLKLGARLAGETTLSLQRATVNIITQKGFKPSLTVWLLEQTQSQYALPFLLDVLKNGCSDTRWRAARALSNFATMTVSPYLIEALTDDDSSVRYKAAESLGKLNSRDAIPYICQLLDDEEWFVRSLVVDVLGELEGIAAVDCLKNALKHQDDSIRTKVAEYLGQRAPQEVIALLNEEFDSGDVDLKRDVLQLLGETKNAAAIPILIRALSEDDWIVRSEAVSQLGLLGIWLDKSLLEDALTALIRILQNDPEIPVRSSAAIYLGIIGDSSVFPVLIEVLSKDDQVVRSSAANALGRLQARSAIRALIRSLQDDDYVREEAIRVLRILNAAEALPEIRKLVHCKLANIRREATLTLGAIGNYKDLAWLYKALKDKEFSVRLCAAYSLSRLNNRKGVAILEYALKTGKKDARNLALEGLKNFKGKVGLSSILSRAFKDDEYSIRKASVDFLEFFKEEQEIVKGLKVALDSQNEDVCRNAMDAAKTLGNAEFLLRLRQLAETIMVVERPLEAIAAIQSRYQFYNYEIAQLKPPQRTEGSETHLLHDKLDIMIQEVKKVSEQPKHVINAENYYEKPERVVNTGKYYEKGTHNHNHNYANDETLKQQIIELRQFVHQLQQTHQPTDESQAIEIIDVEVREIQKTNPTRWQKIQSQLQLLKHQLLNPESHFQATKATLAEVAKHYLEESVVSKAVITYIDTLSADSEKGE